MISHKEYVHWCFDLMQRVHEVLKVKDSYKTNPNFKFHCISDTITGSGRTINNFSYKNEDYIITINSAYSEGYVLEYVVINITPTPYVGMGGTAIMCESTSDGMRSKIDFDGYIHFRGSNTEFMHEVPDKENNRIKQIDLKLLESDEMYFQTSLLYPEIIDHDEVLEMLDIHYSLTDKPAYHVQYFKNKTIEIIEDILC